MKPSFSCYSRLLGTLWFLWVGGAIDADAQSTISPANPYAYAANAGWVNMRSSAEHGVEVRSNLLAGYAYAANFGWIHFGDGSPADGIHYGNDSASDYGVNHDDAGNLSGYAYAANIGWISFEWSGSGDPEAPRINLFNGAFSGKAYSANIGWIQLDTGLTTAFIQRLDSDDDGIDDAWERIHFNNLTTATGTSDADHDGQSDLAEFRSDTNPRDPADRFSIVSYSQFTGSPGLQMHFLAWTSEPSRRYSIVTSPDLADWQPTYVTGLPGFGPVDSQYLMLPELPSRFFRVSAELPLPPP